MKREAEIRELLISNAISLIAEGGFERATVRELVGYSGDLPGFRMNDVYVYRIFGSKENLYAAAFACLDDELYAAFKEGIDAVAVCEGSIEERFFEFFKLAWRFVLRNERRCRCYVRYYYSVYLKGESLAAHKEHFNKIVKDLIPLFSEDADVFSIMHSIFTSLLSFAIRVYNGDLENSELNARHVFNVLYCMLETYLKDSPKV